MTEDIKCNETKVKLEEIALKRKLKSTRFIMTTGTFLLLTLLLIFNQIDQGSFVDALKWVSAGYFGSKAVEHNVSKSSKFGR